MTGNGGVTPRNLKFDSKRGFEWRDSRPGRLTSCETRLWYPMNRRPVVS